MAVEHNNKAIELKYLTGLIGDNLLMQQQMLEAFLSSLPESLSQIKQAIAQQDYDGLIFETHKLKSALKSVGAIPAFTKCVEMENLAKSEKAWPEINTQHAQFLASLEAAQTAIEKILANMEQE